MRVEESDEEIRDKVLQHLRWSPCIQDTPLDVRVEDAVVTLGGTVCSYGARVAAAEAAHQVDEVRDVANDIVVEVVPGMGRTDTEIAQAVRGMLKGDVRVPDEHVTSTVAEGWVTLAGWVERCSEREDAERAIANLAGVQGVINNIRVVHAESRSEQIRRVIEAALERRAKRHAKRIHIEVADGTVTLEGPVESVTERRALLDATRLTPGVELVDDHLRVEPGV